MWNLVFAPYRIERDKRIELEKENIELRVNSVSGDKRTIEPNLKMRLRTILQGKIPENEGLFATTFLNEECQDFAQEFVDLFQEMGAVGSGIGQTIDGGPPVSARDIEILQWRDRNSELVSDFSKALSEAGIKNTVRVCDTDYPREVFRLVVNRPS